MFLQLFDRSERVFGKGLSTLSANGTSLSYSLNQLNMSVNLTDEKYTVFICTIDGFRLNPTKIPRFSSDIIYIIILRKRLWSYIGNTHFWKI